ncbi:MAG: hypothetical protein VCA18_12410, partial [Opitutales bacterium]
TDAEAIGAGHLAGVDHVSLVVQPRVELFKLKVRMTRVAESRDDRALQSGDFGGGQKGSNAKDKDRADGR